MGPSSSQASRGGNEDGSPSDIVIESEPMVCPGVGSLAGLPSAARPDRSTGEPSDRDEDIQSELCTGRHKLPQDGGEAIVVGGRWLGRPWEWKLNL